ncbi:MAG TPA: hypothetical protein PK307_07080 [Spirochaetota bacterium]|nr:hypothetical protein [Spirochaetota bacterium]HOC46044.1 hypothetical protein [Syntrophorhabdaceae bacterium]HPN13618.1 hypothetical protein [Spirochaetota bacterium]HQL81947.1 hypothetical protein [Spirochaetota bacterium]
MNQALSECSIDVKPAPAQPEETSMDICDLGLAAFRSAKPEETAGLSAQVVEMASRVLHDAINGEEPEIDIDAMTDCVIRSLREMKITVIHPFHERLFSFLEAAMRFLADGYGYRKRDMPSYRADIGRIIWPYAARSRGPQGALDALAGAVLDYYDSHREISTGEATDFVFAQCPGILDRETLNTLLNEIFDFLCENGQISEAE